MPSQPRQELRFPRGRSVGCPSCFKLMSLFLLMVITRHERAHNDSSFLVCFLWIFVFFAYFIVVQMIIWTTNDANRAEGGSDILLRTKVCFCFLQFVAGYL